MSIKILCTFSTSLGLPTQFLANRHVRLLCKLFEKPCQHAAPLGCQARPFECRNFSGTKRLHDWRPKTDHAGGGGVERRKLIPKLVYLHSPWQYVCAKLNLWKLRLLWDQEFVEKDFIRGSKQAAIVLTNIIRSQDATKIMEFTTPVGYQQIQRDMLLSENDIRLKLVKFETEHLRRAIPMKVVTRSNYGRRYCFIDMLFVGLRNVKDFATTEEVVEVKRTLDKLDADLGTPKEVLAVPHRIVFAEIFMRFRRNYTRDGDITTTTNSEIRKQLDAARDHWSVCFYKILSFDVLNYDP